MIAVLKQSRNFRHSVLNFASARGGFRRVRLVQCCNKPNFCARIGQMTDNNTIWPQYILLHGRATFDCKVDLSFRHLMVIVGGAES